MDTTWIDDLRLAFRNVRRRPGPAAVAIATLALGIGANAALLGVVEAVLLRPLPLPDADRLVTVAETEDGVPGRMGYATYLDLRAAARSFEGLAASAWWQPVLGGDDAPEQLVGRRISQSFLTVLGIPPLLGRDFLAEEDAPGAPRVVILGDGLWRRRFGADPTILGRAVDLGGTPYTVVGVVPARELALADAPEEARPEIWTPLRYEPSQPWACRTCRHLAVVGRVQGGVAAEKASRELASLVAGMAATSPEEYHRPGALATPLREQVVGEVRPLLAALGGAVGLILLLACVNVASLVLGDAARRRRDLTVRAALGASRLRLARLVLAETLVLAGLGAAVGLGAAALVLSWLAREGPATVPRLENAGVDFSVGAATAVLAAFAALACGVVPALRAAAVGRRGGLGSGARTTVRRAGGLLVTADAALAVLLLAGAGLLLRSVLGLLAVDPGFEPRDVTVADVVVSGAAYRGDDGDAAVAGFYRTVLERIAAAPGVVAAGAVSQLPLGGNQDSYGVEIEGRALANREQAPDADRFAVTSGYLAAMRIPLLRGRALVDADRRDAAPVVLVNESFAAREWPGGDPIGARLRMGGPEAPWRTVVGVVGDVRHHRLDSAPTNQVYVPHDQWLFADAWMTLVVRGPRSDAAATALRAAVRAVDAGQPLGAPTPMSRIVAATVSHRRLLAVAVAAFAAAAMLLAAVGMYGVLSQRVAERTVELGVRAALGAGPRRLGSLVVGAALRPAALGIALGLAATPLAARVIAGQLYGVTPHDPATLAAVAALLLGLVLAAAWIPARRAIGLDPVAALRADG